MAEYTPDEELTDDLLDVALAAGVVSETTLIRMRDDALARHAERQADPTWDNAKVAKERRKKWAAVDERAKASRALSLLLGRSA